MTKSECAENTVYFGHKKSATYHTAQLSTTQPLDLIDVFILVDIVYTHI